MTKEVTPQIRWRLNEAMRHLTPGSNSQRALRHAQYWESFPHSYTDEQVAAAQDLMHAWYAWLETPNVTVDAAHRTMAAIDRIMELADD